MGIAENPNKVGDFLIDLVMNDVLAIFIGIAFFGIIFYVAFKDVFKGIKKIKENQIQKNKEKIDAIKAEEDSIKANAEYEKNRENSILIKLKKADELKIKLDGVQDIKIPIITSYKNVLIENEKLITEKGGDNQLFSFLKVDTFLTDYRERIISDQSGLRDVLDIEWLKAKIKTEGERKDLDKIIENLSDASANLEGRETSGFDANVDKLFELGDKMKPSIENQIMTLDYYCNMASAMIVFYINDKKIRYFQIFEAFEKLGTFDSTWQKNVLNKLESIETRLSQINNQLTELNNNFISLVESSENVVSELKEINSGIITNNMLQAINAYQSWRVNNNTKHLNK
jgi:hypothetical protein